jgi:hypothetical protein
MERNLKGKFFNLYKRFIIETFDHKGWLTIYTYADIQNPTFYEEESEYLFSDFLNLLISSENILSVEKENLLSMFGHYCFIHLLEQTSFDFEKEFTLDYQEQNECSFAEGFLVAGRKYFSKRLQNSKESENMLT